MGFFRTGISLLLCMLLHGLLSAQSKPLRRFTTQQGLPGNHVYAAVQDSKGFMWFATDQGVARFNGRDFAVFTTAHGLSDNEVLGVYEDSDGRIWFICFNTSPSYWYRGKIYNSGNDSFLAKLANYNFYPSSITRDKTAWFSYKLNDSQAAIVNIKDQKPLILSWRYTNNTPQVLHHFSNRNTEYFILGGLYKKQGNRLVLVHSTPNADWSTSRFFVSGDSFFRITGTAMEILRFNAADESLKVLHTVQLPGPMTAGIMDGKKLLLSTTFNNLYHADASGCVPRYPWLRKTETYTNICIDNEDNTWLTTAGNGVYMIPNSPLLLTGSDEGLPQDAINCMTMDEDGNVYLGFRQAGLGMWNAEKGYSQLIPQEVAQQRYRRITSLQKKGENLYIGTDYNFCIFNTKTHKLITETETDQYNISTVKDLELDRNGNLLLANWISASLIQLPEFRFSRSFWRTRTTAIWQSRDGSYWLGTLKGVFTCKEEQSQPRPFALNAKLSDSRITDIKENDAGILFFSTYNNGIFISNGKVCRQLTEANPKQPPASNTILGTLCIKMQIDRNGHCWLVTNKGINEIIVEDNTLDFIRVKRFGTANGLPTGSITDIAISGNKLFVAWEKGLIRINRDEIFKVAAPEIALTRIQINERDTILADRMVFDHTQNSISFEFSGISFRNTGNILYKYRLIGQDTGWEINTINRVRYTGLNPGRYVFQAYAINDDNMMSVRPISVEFTIQEGFYQTGFFRLLATLFSVIAFASIIYLVIRRVKHTQELKAANQRRMAELEMQALRAQINPHFVFNALNSIQHYFMRNEHETANRYLSMFSSLVRKILQTSSQGMINLAEEIQMMKDYLELEKMRFKDRMDYRVSVSTEVEPSRYKIPVMLLQPQIENAVNHGIRHLDNIKGFIELKVEISNNDLIIIISDNGIGYRKSLEDSLQNRSGHVSRGNALTTGRIKALNQAYETNIRIDISSLNDLGEYPGTVIRIHLPLDFVSL